MAVQFLEAGYLLYRGRYVFPVLVFSCSVLAQVAVTVTQRKQYSKAVQLMNTVRLTPIVQDKWVKAMSSHRLVPGDVMVLQQGRALCDMVLLRGTCLVTESMLSGEVTSSSVADST